MLASRKHKYSKILAFPDTYYELIINLLQSVELFCAYFGNRNSWYPKSSIYYCDPMRSGQKGALEQAHTMLRMVLPKGTSFEFLTQWDLNLIVNHINSTPRESLGGKTPYEAALETLGEDILKAFQLKPIAPDEVNLTPKLIRFNR